MQPAGVARGLRRPCRDLELRSRSPGKGQSATVLSPERHLPSFPRWHSATAALWPKMQAAAMNRQSRARSWKCFSHQITPSWSKFSLSPQGAPAVDRPSSSTGQPSNCTAQELSEKRFDRLRPATGSAMPRRHLRELRGSWTLELLKIAVGGRRRCGRWRRLRPSPRRGRLGRVPEHKCPTQRAGSGVGKPPGSALSFECRHMQSPTLRDSRTNAFSKLSTL